MIHCLHGNLGSSRDWEVFDGKFDLEIVAPDLWSLIESGSASLPEAGAKIAEAAEKDDVLLGYSMGGRLALHALLAAPRKWRAAIIISAHPGLIEGHEARLVSDARWAGLARDDWEDFLKKWNGLDILATKSSTMPGLHQTGRDRQIEVARAFHDWSLGTQKDLRPQFPMLDLPILWITGEFDEKFTRLAKEAVALLPNARHLIVPTAGHRVPWEQTIPFASAVRGFLSSSNPRPRRL